MSPPSFEAPWQEPEVVVSHESHEECCDCKSHKEPVEVDLPQNDRRAADESLETELVVPTLQPTGSSELARFRQWKPSNECLLGTACVTFMSFAIVQLSFAKVARSDSLLGDGAAMIVDGIMYLCNWYAEHKKRQLEKEGTLSDRDKRVYILKYEMIPSVLSVTSLLVITILIMRQAVGTLVLDAHHDTSQQYTPQVKVMLIFSSLNLFLDFVNVFFFAKAKHLCGYRTIQRDDEEEQPVSVTTKTSREVDGCCEQEGGGFCEENDEACCKDEAFLANQARRSVFSYSKHDHTNLNMCSAYTHVFADTLRSLAVIAAALIAMFVPQVSGEEADAAAAVCVSALIVLSVLPLFQGLWNDMCELRSIRAQERKEKKKAENKERPEKQGDAQQDE